MQEKNVIFKCIDLKKLADDKFVTFFSQRKQGLKFHVRVPTVFETVGKFSVFPSSPMYSIILRVP